MADKPRYTEPCNHCGLCCRMELCHVAKELFREDALPCPALRDDGKCSLVIAEAQTGLKPLIAQSLGIGTGCSAPDADTTEAEIEAFDRRSFIKVYGREPSAPQAHDLCTSNGGQG